jgi:hypothetical protein
MACSPEQLASNCRNSLKSKGPTSPEGKSRSRRNGLKHGMTGAGIVIADEDVEALDERLEAFEAALKPVNDVARFLTQRAALLAVKLDRSAREEAARINLDMLEAEECEEEEATLARKYEANAERMLHQTLKKIEEINATAAAAETVEVEEKPEPEKVCDVLASSLPEEVGQVETPEESRGEHAARTGTTT